MADQDCIFCKIVAGEIPSQKVFEDEEVLAFHDISPQAPVHVLIIPKQHIARVADMTEAEEPLMGKLIHTAAQLARQLNVSDSGYRLVLNTGPDANQTVPHVHVHLIGGRVMGWPPG